MLFGKTELSRPIHNECSQLIRRGQTYVFVLCHDMY